MLGGQGNTSVTGDQNTSRGLCGESPGAVYEVYCNMLETQKMADQIFVKLVRTASVCAALARPLSSQPPFCDQNHLKISAVGRLRLISMRNRMVETLRTILQLLEILPIPKLYNHHLNILQHQCRPRNDAYGAGSLQCSRNLGPPYGPNAPRGSHHIPTEQQGYPSQLQQSAPYTVQPSVPYAPYPQSNACPQRRDQEAQAPQPADANYACLQNDQVYRAFLEAGVQTRLPEDQGSS